MKLILLYEIILNKCFPRAYIMGTDLFGNYYDPEHLQTDDAES